MNVELLEKVKRHILEEPRRVEMCEALGPSRKAPCGTIGCLAGWGLVVDDPDYEAAIRKWGLAPWGYDWQMPVGLDPEDEERESVFWSAARKYELTERQARRLFHVECWPEGWAEELDEAGRPEEYAAVVVARVDAFIASGGAE